MESRDFQSGVPQSMVLFPETLAGTQLYNGIPIPKNFGNFTKAAQDYYISEYTTALILGCTPSKCHAAAMDQIKKRFIKKNGKWQLPDPI